MNEFGRLVRRLRVSRGLSIRELSRQATREIGGRGLSAPYMSAIERGLLPAPRSPMRAVLSRILQVSREVLEFAANPWLSEVYVIQAGERHYGLTEPQAIVSSLDKAKLLVFTLYTDASKVKAIDRRHWIAKRTRVDYVQITKVRLDA